MIRHTGTSWAPWYVVPADNKWFTRLVVAEVVVQALESWKMNRGDYSAQYRSFDHQMMNRILVAGIHPKITDEWDYFDVKAELPTTKGEMDIAFGSEAQIGCKMGDL